MADERKQGTIVLVHGAWSDGSIWTEVLVNLAHQGYKVRAAQIPLTSFAADVAAVELLLNQVAGPVLLVGHSYGGAVITQAGHHPKVKALAYITAFAPEPDEVFGSIMGLHPAKEGLTLVPDAKGFLWLDSDFAASALGQDLHIGTVRLAVAVQKPIHAEVFAQKLSDPAWKMRRNSYLITTEDRVLAPETQHLLATRIGARTEEVAAGHFVPLSQPQAVANFLKTSADALSAL